MDVSHYWSNLFKEIRKKSVRSANGLNFCQLVTPSLSIPLNLGTFLCYEMILQNHIINCYLLITWLYSSLEPQSADHSDDLAFSDKEKMLVDLKPHTERSSLFVQLTDIPQF